MAKRLNALEKELLIRLYKGNPTVKAGDFCEANGISVSSLRKWVSQYDEAGLEGLAKGESLPSILPDGMDRTEENYKRQILKLTIENERLKREYSVEKKPDGRTTFAPLSRKSSK